MHEISRSVNNRQKFRIFHFTLGGKYSKNVICSHLNCVEFSRKRRKLSNDVYRYVTVIKLHLGYFLFSQWTRCILHEKKNRILLINLYSCGRILLAYIRCGQPTDIYYAHAKPLSLITLRAPKFVHYACNFYIPVTHCCKRLSFAF